jgi:hypothetical protein
VNEKLSHKANAANVNLFAKLAAAFPPELGSCAVETDTQGKGVRYQPLAIDSNRHC